MLLPRTPSFRLDPKRALVIASGRGLGLAAAALVARGAGEIEGADAAIRAAGGAAEAPPLDVLDTARTGEVCARLRLREGFVGHAEQANIRVRRSGRRNFARGMAAE